MLILKIGGSAITDKAKFEKANRHAMKGIAKAIARALRRKKIPLILVHGGGSFGHHNVIKYGIRDGVRTGRQWLGFCKTRESMMRLARMFTAELKQAGIPVVHLPPCSLLLQKNKRISYFNTKPVFDALREGKMPLLHGDMVLDEAIGASVCSGDQLCSYLGKKAGRIVMASNVDGILAEGKVVTKITAKNKRDVLKHVGDAGSKDVTGGMRGKLLEIFKTGKPTYIVNAKKPERITALLLGKKTICTEIKV